MSGKELRSLGGPYFLSFAISAVATLAICVVTTVRPSPTLPMRTSVNHSQGRADRFVDLASNPLGSPQKQHAS